MKRLPNINYINIQLKKAESQMNEALEMYHLIKDPEQKTKLEELITSTYNTLEDFRKLKIDIEKTQKEINESKRY